MIFNFNNTKVRFILILISLISIIFLLDISEKYISKHRSVYVDYQYKIEIFNSNNDIISTKKITNYRIRGKWIITETYSNIYWNNKFKRSNYISSQKFLIQNTKITKLK